MNTAMLSKVRHSPPSPGYLIRYNPQLDSGDDRVPDLLNFTAMKGLIDASLDGEADALLELNGEMEARDLHLRRVAATRRGALTGMEYRIEPVESVQDETSKGLAIEAGDFIRSELERITTFRKCLRKMATAIGPNLAVVELIWGAGANTGRVVDFGPIGHSRLTIDQQSSPRVLIVTMGNPQGSEMPLDKFITHVPDDVGTNIFSNTLTRAMAAIWVTKHFAMQDWGTFCEVFGMPVRVAQYGKNTTPAEKAEALAAMASMGSKAYMLLSDKMQYEMKEVNRQSQPFGGADGIVEYCQRQQAIGYLGQNLTTDTTGSGGLGGAGAAQVHQHTLRIITEEDAANEAQTLREQLFRPMLKYRYPDRWEQMPVPHFVRVWRDPDLTQVEQAEVIRKASQEIGLSVPVAWAKQRLGIPDVEDNEAIIQRFEPVAAPMGGGF